MSVRELLAARKDALCARWLAAILAEYGEETAARWRRERDPFANPIGHALAAGLPELLDAVASDGAPAPAAAAALEAIVRIRSVQELAPSRAVGFVFLLRDALRDELAAELSGGGHAAELAAVHARIEGLALRAFDAYAAMREQVFRVRQAELKRSVASLLRRWNGAELDDLSGAASGVEPSGAPRAPGPPHRAPELTASDLVQLSRPAIGGARR